VPCFALQGRKYVFGYPTDPKKCVFSSPLPGRKILRIWHPGGAGKVYKNQVHQGLHPFGECPLATAGSPALFCLGKTTVTKLRAQSRSSEHTQYKYIHWEAKSSYFYGHIYAYRRNHFYFYVHVINGGRSMGLIRWWE